MYATSDIAWGGGGTNKKLELEPEPFKVVTLKCPEVMTPGIEVERLVLVAALANVLVRLTARASFDAVGSKFVPLTVTDVPAAAIAGVKLVIVGAAPPEVVTVNDELLVALPDGDVTLIAPVVAPVGTAVTIWVAVDDVTVAATPLKVTEFWPALALKPVP